MNRYLTVAGFLLLPFLGLAFTGKKQIIEAETAKSINGAFVLSDKSASGKYLVSLTKAGQAIKFINLPAANKLAIRYASVEVGTITVSVNKQAVKVNIHSSGGRNAKGDERRNTR